MVQDSNIEHLSQLQNTDPNYDPNYLFIRHLFSLSYFEFISIARDTRYAFSLNIDETGLNFLALFFASSERELRPFFVSLDFDLRGLHFMLAPATGIMVTFVLHMHGIFNRRFSQYPLHKLSLVFMKRLEVTANLEVRSSQLLLWKVNRHEVAKRFKASIHYSNL